MAIVIEAPNETYSLQNNRNQKLFIAGGITNCPEWQLDLIDRLMPVVDLTIFNPRRKNFQSNNPAIEEEQIVWEYNKLREANLISFWFSAGSLNPITLYELGKHGNSSKKQIFVGCDKNYERKYDVMIQTHLARPEIEIVYSIKDLALQIIDIVE
jgi:hypothetical protein